MQKSIAKLLDAATQRGGDDPDFFEWYRDEAFQVYSACSDALQAFNVVVSDGTGKSQLHPKSESAPPEVMQLARETWRWCGGESSIDRGRLLVQLARLEFARSVLSHNMWMVSRWTTFSQQPAAYTERLLLSMKQQCSLAPEDMMLAEIEPDTISSETALDVFSDWTFQGTEEMYTFNKYPPVSGRQKILREDLMYAAALVWLDGALSTEHPDKKVKHLASAAFAMREGGFSDGWTALAEMQKGDAARNGKLGAQAKYRRTNALKDWALAELRPTDPRSLPMARTLAKRLPEHLADVSDDPVRLIYDAIRRPSKALSENQ